ncbi:MAG: sulfatase-like hydrolase/transferase, partial [bacterium]|nr:sulfatase-like hydrolase/transferase [bacterium]
MLIRYAVLFLLLAASAIAEKPNFIVIFADDLGYGDLASYGHPTFQTPHLDRMAAEGARFTDFYVPMPYCAPSRATLLTGRYPMRIGGGWKTNGDEITVAEVLKEVGCSTGCVGKWDISQRRYQEGLVPND